jgi:hypothetical protein
MPNMAQLTTSELRQLIQHTEALSAMRRALPVGLYTKLDTFHADLLMEQEDRAEAEIQSRREAVLRHAGGRTADGISVTPLPLANQ